MAQCWPHRLGIFAGMREKLSRFKEFIVYASNSALFWKPSIRPAVMILRRAVHLARTMMYHALGNIRGAYVSVLGASQMKWKSAIAARSREYTYFKGVDAEWFDKVVGCEEACGRT